MAEQSRLIKKYPNRRLYDTRTSSYITLADVKELVLGREEFQVVDAKTGEDLTRSILLQIILEEEAGGAPMFTSDLLAHSDADLFGKDVAAGLRATDAAALASGKPVIPVLVGDPEPTMALSRALLERGVFAHGIRPPTVPAGTGRLRVVPMASHSAEDIQSALAAFAALRSA